MTEIVIEVYNTITLSTTKFINIDLQNKSAVHDYLDLRT